MRARSSAAGSSGAPGMIFSSRMATGSERGAPAPLDEAVAGVGCEICKCFGFSGRPADDHILDFPGVSESEVEPFGRLADESLSSPEGLNKRFLVGAFEVDFHPGTDGVMSGVCSVSLEMEGNEMIRMRLVISEEAEPGGVAVGDPEVEVAVLIPVDRGDSPAIVGEIETGDRGDRGEAGAPVLDLSNVKKDAIAFAAAE